MSRLASGLCYYVFKWCMVAMWSGLASGLCYYVFKWCMVAMWRGQLPMMFLNGVFHIDVGARCSSVVRAFAYGAMGRRIDFMGSDIW